MLNLLRGETTPRAQGAGGPSLVLLFLGTRALAIGYPQIVSTIRIYALLPAVHTQGPIRRAFLPVNLGRDSEMASCVPTS